jgi:formaldehyde-activating enzyme involved in methanogenesis
VPNRFKNDSLKNHIEAKIGKVKIVNNRIFIVCLAASFRKGIYKLHANLAPNELMSRPALLYVCVFSTPGAHYIHIYSKMAH